MTKTALSPLKLLFHSLLLLLLFSPLFFIFFRLIAFETTPLDNYLDYASYYSGTHDHLLKESPLGYRLYFPFISAIIAEIMPVIPLTNLNGNNLSLIKLQQGQALNCYLHFMGCIMLTYYFVRHNLSRDKTSSLLTSLVIGALLLYTSFISIDPATIFIIMLAYIFLENKPFFGAIMVVSPIINEKIAIVYLLYFLLKWLNDKKLTFSFQLFAAIVGVLLYFSIRMVFPLTGNENQINILTFIPHLMDNSIQIFSLKGMYMNVLPVALLIFIHLKFRKAISDNLIRNNRYLHLLILMLFFLAASTAHAFTPGRVALHSLPFFIPSIVIFIETRIVNPSF